MNKLGRTLTDLVKSVCDEIGADSSNTTTSILLKKFINKAYKELAIREGIEKSISVATNNYLITKPSDFYKVSKIVYQDSILPYSEEESYIRVDYEGDMTLHYYKTVSDMGDNDTPETHLANDSFIIDFAKYKYHQHEEEYDKAEVAKRDYETFNIRKSKKSLQFAVVR